MSSEQGSLPNTKLCYCPKSKYKNIKAPFKKPKGRPTATDTSVFLEDNKEERHKN